MVIRSPCILCPLSPLLQEIFFSDGFPVGFPLFMKYVLFLGRMTCLNPFRTAVPFWGQSTWNLTGLSPQRDCGSKRVNPFSTAVLFWGQTTQTSSILSPKRDCGQKRAQHFLTICDISMSYLQSTGRACTTRRVYLDPAIYVSPDEISLTIPPTVLIFMYSRNPVKYLRKNCQECQNTHSSVQELGYQDTRRFTRPRCDFPHHTVSGRSMLRKIGSDR